MRLLKKCRWIRTFLAAILIISMASQSLTTYAAGSESGTDDGSSANGMPKTTGDQSVISGGGYGWLVSIQEVDNTATDTSSGYAESEISFANAWLYDFPSCYYSTDANSAYKNPEKYAFIRSGSSSTTKYYVANPSVGNTSRSSGTVQFYNASSGSGSFSSNAQLLEGSSYYETILTGIKAYSLTSEYVIYAAESTGKLQSAINSFVGLWKSSGSVDDTINDFVFSSDDYWDQVIRYLDLLIIVNAMCGNAWSSEGTDYIQYYLENLNQDGSEKFVAVVAAAVANCAVDTAGTKALMTLPVYYSKKTSLSTSSFTHWDGAGGGDIYSTASTNWSDIQNSFNNMGSSSWWKMTTNNTNSIWWDDNFAHTVYPVGLDGSSSPGFVGYTYIAPVLITDDPDDIINPPSSSSSPSSSVAATDVVTPTFTVEVTTENEYMQRDTSQPVTATVTIDMGQTDAVQKTFKNIYTSLKNKEAETGESYKTAIEVFVERTITNDGGANIRNDVMDSDHSNGYFASAVQPTLPSAVVYRWQGTDWDSGSNQLQYVMDGTHQIVFDDEGLSLEDVTEGTPLNATYHVGIRMAIYPSSVSDEDAFDKAEYLWIFQGEGKTICSDSGNSDCSTTFFNNSTTSISTSQSAHDDAEWICPKGVQWYSSLRDKNIDALLSQRATKHESRLLRSDELPQLPPVFAIRIIWLKNSQISYLLIQASPSDVYVSLYASIQST